MTAPSCKRPLTAEVLDAFREYHRREPSWGIFHVALDDGNYKSDAAPERWLDRTYTDEERRLAAIFAELSPSQRAKVAGRC